MAAEIINKKIRLSVIVPVYNLATYVECCIRSLEDQDIPEDDYEIICINDGSTDNSRDIIINLQKEFSNIFLIDQTNQGVSCARNIGINNAKGKYLLFVDSDDYVDANCLERILNNINRYKAQLSYLGFTILNENGTIRKQIFNESNSNQVFTGIEASFIARGDRRYDPNRIWAILFNLDFLNQFNLRFLPGVPFSEDAEFITRTLCLAECCIFDGFSFYLRSNRPGSAINSNLLYTEKATIGLIMIAENLKKFQQADTLTSSQKEFLNQYICRHVVRSFHSASIPFSLKKIGAVKKKLVESGLRKVELKSVYEPYAKQGYLYNRAVCLLLIYQFLTGKLHSLRLRLIRITHKMGICKSRSFI